MSKEKIELDTETKEFLTSCKGLGDEVDRLRAELKKKVEAFFKDKVSFILRKFPYISYITWQQYTPGFCDGDPCHFSSNHDCAGINGSTEENWTDEDIKYNIVDLPLGVTVEQASDTKNGPPDLMAEPAETVVRKFLGAFTDEDMLDMFGNNVEVKVTKNGIDVGDYECGY